jgi:hypothetical protein
MSIYRRRHEMKRICLLALALVALGALPATAGAKEVTAVKVCGASGCNEVTGQSALKPFFEDNGGPPTETFNAPVGSYYSVEMSYADPEGNTVGSNLSYWLPAAALMHGSDQSSYDPWWQLTAAQSTAMKGIAAGVDPFTPALSRVLVNGRAVADPNSYIRLFGNFPPSYRVAPKKSRWIKISITPAHSNPWLQRATRLRYQPGLRLLQRPDYGQVVLPKAVGNLLVKRASLAAVKSGSGGGHTALYAGVGVAGAAAIALLAAVRRKRMQ